MVLCASLIRGTRGVEGIRSIPTSASPRRVELGRAKAGSVRDTFEKIRSKDAKVGIIGLGYVGFPLAFAEKYTVRGYDADKKGQEKLRNGRSQPPRVGPLAAWDERCAGNAVRNQSFGGRLDIVREIVQASSERLAGPVWRKVDAEERGYSSPLIQLGEGALGARTQDSVGGHDEHEPADRQPVPGPPG